jgi:hypothetical protein
MHLALALEARVWAVLVWAVWGVGLVVALAEQALGERFAGR